MPHALTLRPATRVLRRAPGEVQIGTDPRWAVRLVGLSAAEERWLQSLEPRFGADGAPCATTADLRPPAQRRGTLLRLLEEAGLLVRRRPRRRVSTGPGNGDAELPVLDAVRHDGAGHRALAGRARAVVGVVGIGRLGATLATTLATAGVGTIVAHETAPVLATDVGLGGFRLRDVGAPRGLALARILGEVAPGVTTASGRVPDVVVVVEHDAADPDRVRELVGDGVAHLSIVVREADVVVGPFVRPGLDPCVRCVDLRRRDVDPCWPQMARQLRDAVGPGYEDAVLSSVAASVASGQVLAAIDGDVPRTATACLEILAPDAVPRLRGTTSHPECGCTELRGAPPDGTPLVRAGLAPRATSTRTSGDRTRIG
ncbi:thiamine biosynthesis protein ThiF [Cellulosimicrobium arenosum]|uniref:Thiamine biosynthesis protein ThiF n=1 Tax=Cellulosimicrobium arenosum TaxID=2708133 RepID=A0A927G7P2_9MICO|nr:thiamine biosynthesis protein ThiF [Cellulosimicrobium arenosum]MBD8078230.1 thiamine biosynthesis protein ThiF [Cellulosimicrobium arenosum]